MYKLSKNMKVNYKRSNRCGCKASICKLGSTSFEVHQMVLRDEVYEVANNRNGSERVPLGNNHTCTVQNKGFNTLNGGHNFVSIGLG